MVRVSSDYQLGRIQNHLRDKHPDVSEGILLGVNGGRKVNTDCGWHHPMGWWKNQKEEVS